ncbi:MAG: peptidoglycan D,D-transpeptidase FtsI family protein [Patescibacteria group bacterium UBA2163]
MRKQFVGRIRIIAAVLIILSIILLVRLYTLQVVHGDSFRLRAEGQYSTPSANYFDRGSIFFSPRHGVPFGAATLDSGFILAIIPGEIDYPAEVYASLSEYIDIDSEEFFIKTAKKDDPYEEIKHRVPLEVGRELIAQEIPGVRLYRQQWRTYPAGKAAAHTVGFIGYGSSNELSGQYGLERFYDDILTKPNTGLYINFFADVFAGIRTSILNDTTQPGANVVTGIEPTVQFFLEDLVTRYKEEWNPREVGAIILDPSTGEVVALSALPVFDPNKIAEADPSTFANPLVENVYEFGSIVKPLTVAAGLDAGVITPETTYNDKGSAVYDTARIANYDGKARGVVSMQEVLNQSLNTGVAFIVEELGTKQFSDYFDAFAIDKKTGIDLPNEATPLVANLGSPRTIEYVTASFGQGIAVTPIAMARSLATLANNGIVPTPHIAVEFEYPGLLNKKNIPKPGTSAISEETNETITRMLVEVVDTALRDGTVKIPEMSIAAKTGTAQIAQKGERGYYDDRYLHSFFGYFPAYDPQFFLFFYAVEPQGARYASETWTTPFMEGVHFLTSYYSIQPDRLPAQGVTPLSTTSE